MKNRTDLSTATAARGSGRPREFDIDAALGAALELFWHRGYAATSLTELSEAMGIARSSLYTCFGSKHEVLTRAIERYADEGLAELERIAVETADPVLAIRRMLLQLAEPGGGAQGCFLVNCITELAPEDPSVVAVAQRVTERVQMLLVDALLAVPSASPLTRRVAVPRARALLSTAFGATLMRKNGMARRDVRAMLAASEALIVAG